MLKVKTFVFNAFQVNTYIVYAENNDCIIVDPACSSATEVTRLTDYLKKENLKPLLVVNTHAHVDHILGNAAITEKLNLKLAAHPKSAYFYLNGAPLAQHCAKYAREQLRNMESMLHNNLYGKIKFVIFNKFNYLK